VACVWTPVSSSNLPFKFYLVTEGVTECGAAIKTRPRGNLCGIVKLPPNIGSGMTDNSLRKSFYLVTGCVTEGGSVDVTRLTGGPGWTSMKEAINKNRVWTPLTNTNTFTNVPLFWRA